MDVHPAPSRHHTDYRAELKLGPAAPPCQEDRFDSGLDSLKEDELVHELEELHMDTHEERTHEYEPWRRALTDDGDS
ncbi:hypothetical protein EYF80_063003 [Liparis tanakae]|uniref:Uncharacterized protein n=1 Tax=Liparis tanakae TaxID=230148 RepID=A0A4Z2EDL7_9TELE|nr:hypothetical protein EYF80_063003 [Liparis tanakae]